MTKIILLYLRPLFRINNTRILFTRFSAQYKNREIAIRKSFTSSGCLESAIKYWSPYFPKDGDKNPRKMNKWFSDRADGTCGMMNYSFDKREFENFEDISIMKYLCLAILQGLCYCVTAKEL